MDNTFANLLRGDFNGKGELVVSLKATVPVFISYPEIIIPFKSRMSDIVPYYVEKEDYTDMTRNILIPDLPSPTQLIVLFTKVFEVIVKLFNNGNSFLESMPKISLKIDIGNNASQFETISPKESQIEQFDNSKTKMFTITGYNAAEKSDTLSKEQKHNLLLVDILTRKYNNSGLGGRR